MVALSEHCSDCNAKADDGNIEVNAGSILSLFTLDIEEVITVTIFGEEEKIDATVQKIEDDPRLNSYIIFGENPDEELFFLEKKQQKKRLKKLLNKRSYC